MSNLQLNPAGQTGTGSKDTILPALRAGIDDTGTFSLADGRQVRRRRAMNRLRFSDLGLRPFRVF